MAGGRLHRHQPVERGRPGPPPFAPQRRKVDIAGRQPTVGKARNLAAGRNPLGVQQRRQPQRGRNQKPQCHGLVDPPHPSVEAVPRQRRRKIARAIDQPRRHQRRCRQARRRPAILRHTRGQRPARPGGQRQNRNRQQPRQRAHRQGSHGARVGALDRDGYQRHRQGGKGQQQRCRRQAGEQPARATQRKLAQKHRDHGGGRQDQQAQQPNHQRRRRARGQLVQHRQRQAEDQARKGEHDLGPRAQFAHQVDIDQPQQLVGQQVAQPEQPDKQRRGADPHGDRPGFAEQHGIGTPLARMAAQCDQERHRHKTQQQHRGERVQAVGERRRGVEAKAGPPDQPAHRRAKRRCQQHRTDHRDRPGHAQRGTGKGGRPRQRGQRRAPAFEIVERRQPPQRVAGRRAEQRQCDPVQKVSAPPVHRAPRLRPPI